MSQSKLKAQTKELQSKLAMFCRTGVEPELEGITKNRLQHYRRLVYNVVYDALRTAYPLTFDLLPSKKWDQLVKLFFETHNCQAYQVWRMPEEFYQFAINQSELDLGKFPFIKDLLLLEWKELELFCMEDAKMPAKSESREVLKLNPEYEVLQLNWPVHKMNSRFITHSHKALYFVLVFRELEDKKVRFIELSKAHILFLAALEEFDGKLYSAYEKTAEQLKLESPEYVAQQLQSFVAELEQKGMLI